MNICNVAFQILAFLKMLNAGIVNRLTRLSHLNAVGDEWEGYTHVVGLA